ncbi:hypothetical protein [Ferrimonas balearica]|uniref:hypothetical protein n=1 Tax=Ferrimonas balearica TaxID=44012 RepID=UPI001C99E2FD|nr:hypothetical protein [Ferrimonas balearica]MBY5992397.1 hypothetical protein [Ferrimonas balearica]
MSLYLLFFIAAGLSILLWLETLVLAVQRRKTLALRLGMLAAVCTAVAMMALDSEAFAVDACLDQGGPVPL